jgi:hypothetical protein
MDEDNICLVQSQLSCVLLVFQDPAFARSEQITITGKVNNTH